MLGKKRSLLRDGEHTDAVVIKAHPLGSEYPPKRWRLSVRARFADGSTVEGTDTVGSNYFGGSPVVFSEGDIVPVRYDPADCGTLVVDLPAMTARQAQAGTERDQQRIADAEKRLSDSSDLS